MKKLFILISAFFIISCSDQEKIPDVSNIQVSVNLMRFEQDFFSIDTNRIDDQMQELFKKYGNFTSIYMNNILGLTYHKDSIEANEFAIKLFIKSYKNVFDSVQNKFTSINKEKEEIENGFKFLKHYFPNYLLPQNIISFVGPVDGVGIGLTENSLVIGLQMYMGKDFVFYKNDYIRSIYPEYKSNRFEREYIAVNAITTIINDMYPENLSGKALIDIMIDEGKKMYILKKVLPKTKQHLLFGYTEEQLKGCLNNEANIWNLFIVNDLLFQNEYQIIKDFINDGPKTQLLGDASPGYISKFIGYRIVEKWMKANNKSLGDLLKTNNRAIYTEAKYKPK